MIHVAHRPKSMLPLIGLKVSGGVMEDPSLAAVRST